jgi:hypothetical protein
MGKAQWPRTEYIYDGSKSGQIGMGGPHVGSMGGASFGASRIAGTRIGRDFHGGHFSNGNWGDGGRQPGFYGYDYGYGGCARVRRQANW